MTDANRKLLAEEIKKYIEPEKSRIPVGCASHLDVKRDGVVDFYDIVYAGNPNVTLDEDVDRIWNDYQACRAAEKRSRLLGVLILAGIGLGIAYVLKKKR